ncbi:MAG: hdh, partial [Candidatus Brocadiaceae bacterium]|nr:hdh [Candidatus Brocadiaceae bacterium]
MVASWLLYTTIKDVRKEKVMGKHWTWTLTSALIMCGTIGVISNLEMKEAKAVEIITHWVPHEVYGQPGEPDNNGKVFF